MKKNKRPQFIIALLFLGFLVISFSSCQKTLSSGSNSTIPPDKNQFAIRLTDDPSFFDSVVINLQGIAVKIDTAASMADSTNHHPRFFNWNACFNDQPDSNAIWDTISSFMPGMYNLSDLSNGVDTLLTSDLIPKGNILAIRVTLGTGSYLVKDSVKYPLNLWNGDANVYIRVYGDQLQKLSTGNYRLWLDFDAGRSVLMVRAGEFYIKPYIRAFVVSNEGSVVGTALPHAAYPVISLYNSMDTLYALPRGDGYFMIPGVDPGTYSVFINASNGYNDTTINNVQVTIGQQTDIGVIHLSN
jgi:Domain of unknown function (DUF4382)